MYSFAIHTWVFSAPGIQICIWCCYFPPRMVSYMCLYLLLSNLVFPRHIFSFHVYIHLFLCFLSGSTGQFICSYCSTILCVISVALV